MTAIDISAVDSYIQFIQKNFSRFGDAIQDRSYTILVGIK